jgi:biotin operon repressor
MSFKITIVETPVPQASNLNEKLMWFGSSLGLFGNRDKDKSMFRIFIEMLKYARGGIPVSSDELALRLGLTRGTVIHHINKLISSGLIVVENNRYHLRVSSLRSLVKEMERDLEKQLAEIKTVASEIDELLELE